MTSVYFISTGYDKCLLNIGLVTWKVSVYYRTGYLKGVQMYV